MRRERSRETPPHREDSREEGQPSRRRAGELSGLILEILRGHPGALTPGEVSERLGAAGAGELAYSTVVTTLSRLHAHGVLERSRTGRAFAYRAETDPARLAAGKMRRVLDAEGDRAAVLASFVGELSDRDERLLRGLLGAAGLDAIEPNGVDR
ncbi:BlaI/MecI/CopY family transcriptional regulator [Nocardia sp. NPDC020380]|uniref:BlaI/MecI/CopY family transcriptional regulator n=1 Tax=Nocardia sp. NPDC020380 TaxID=3364309 RepID=UPI00379F97B9